MSGKAQACRLKMKATPASSELTHHPHDQSYRQGISRITLTEWISAARSYGLAPAEKDDGAGSLIRKGGSVHLE